MAIYRRHLPHISELGRPTFITWRLHGSLPPNRPFPSGTLTSGRAFVAMDRLLDQARTGPFYLSQPEIAEMVVEAIYYGAQTLNHYDLHAFVVMPNHVHILLTPNVPLNQLTKSLKGITAKRANAALNQIGQPFWQVESYDHIARTEQQFEKIRRYLEENPIRWSLS